MRVILGLILISTSQVFGNIPPCCKPDEHTLVPENTTTTVCYHIEKKVSSELPIGCPDPEALDMESLKLKINQGQLEITYDGSTTIAERGGYCSHKMLLDITPEGEAITEDNLFWCPVTANTWDYTLGQCAAVSAAFYILTALIYMALSELRDLLGKSIICLCLSFGGALLLMAILRLVPYYDMALCAAKGFAAYFCLISSFFWMNAISIQCLQNYKRPSPSNYKSRNFVWYFLYAYGCPALFTIITALVNFLPGDHAKPGIGKNHCWFEGRMQLWIYVYSVLSLIIIVNTAIFTYICVHLCRAKFASNQIRALKFKLQISIVLFLIMGIPYFFEIIGFYSNNDSHIIITILDVLTSLHGVVTFLVLVILRTRAIKAMHRRGWFLCLSDRAGQCLAAANDAEDDVIEHTGIPLESNSFK